MSLSAEITENTLSLSPPVPTALAEDNLKQRVSLNALTPLKLRLRAPRFLVLISTRSSWWDTGRNACGSVPARPRLRTPNAGTLF